MEKMKNLKGKAQQAVLDLFSVSTGLPGGLFELDGDEILSHFSVNSLERFEDYCRMIQSIPKGKALCTRDHCFRAKNIIKTRERKLTCCHAGLWNQASPVLIDGEVKAVFLFGETLIDNPEYMEKTMEKYSIVVNELGLDQEESSKLFSKLNNAKTMPLDKLEELGSLLPDIEKYLYFLIEEENKQKQNLEKAVHELQTRLQAIISLSENTLFEVTTIKEKQLRTIAHKMLNRAEALATIINNLGEFQQHYQYKPVRIISLINEAWRVYEDEASYRNVGRKINFEKIHGKDPIVDLSRRQMELAFNNLIHNAVKYSYWGSEENERYVQVLGRLRGEEYVIEISNYGIGMKEEEIADELIFSDGYQGEYTENENRTGSGKGLAYASRVIRKHSGSIKAKSIPKGDPGQALPKRPHINIFIISLPINQKKENE